MIAFSYFLSSWRNASWRGSSSLYFFGVSFTTAELIEEFCERPEGKMGFASNKSSCQCCNSVVYTKWFSNKNESREIQPQSSITQWTWTDRLLPWKELLSTNQNAERCKLFHKYQMRIKFNTWTVARNGKHTQRCLRNMYMGDFYSKSLKFSQTRRKLFPIRTKAQLFSDKRFAKKYIVVFCFADVRGPSTTK